VDLRATLFEACDVADERGGTPWREGHEFRDQEQLPASVRRAAVTAPVAGATTPVAGATTPVAGATTPVAGANVVRLVRQVVRELLLMEVTGQMPGGKDWCSQPWWRVSLWEAFWQGHAQAGGDEAC